MSSLQESGHEIGLHTHGDEFAARTYSALVDECGVTPSTASGIQFSIAMAPTPLAGAEGWLVEMESLGLTTVLAGLGVSDSPLSFVCETYDEESRDDDANALLHSWLSDPQDPCTSDPAGELAIITHSDRDTRAMATINTGLDNVDADDFATWSAQLDAAIGAADPLSTWGVVMALPAMMTDASADPTYLVELDSFLTDLSDHIDAGTVVSVTAAEAAASLR